MGFFLRVENFDGALKRMTDAGVKFVDAPREEPYGRVAVFVDIAGNRWISSDLRTLRSRAAGPTFRRGEL